MMNSSDGITKEFNNRLPMVFLFLKQKRESMQAGPFILLTALLLLLGGCHSTRDVARAPTGFYQEYARVLKMPLTGKESPALIREVSAWMGTPYVFGGITPRGADCSGFVLNVYQKIYDVQLPRTTRGMAQHARRVSRNHLQEGHLVFFRTEARRISHVGIYLGQGYFIHVSSSKGVMVNHLDEPYYARTFAYGGWVKQDL